MPAWIVDGYETLFAEIDAQLFAAGVSAADLVSVQVGVGSLAQAAVAHYRSSARSSALPASARPRLLSVEPDTAACVLRSLADDALVSVPTEVTVMNGLNCGTLLARLAVPARLRRDHRHRPRGARGDRRLTTAGIPAVPRRGLAFAGPRAALTGPRCSGARTLTSASASALIAAPPIGTGGSSASAPRARSSTINDPVLLRWLRNPYNLPERQRVPFAVISTAKVPRSCLMPENRQPSDQAHPNGPPGGA